jgi:hypothetical protein
MSRANTAVVRPRTAGSAKRKRVVATVRKIAQLVPRPVAQQFLQLELARVVQVDDKRVLVDTGGAGGVPQAAHTVVAHADLQPDDQVVVGRLASAQGQLVILGRLFDPLAPPRDVRVNGRKVSIEANTELVLKCSSATVRIAHDGLVSVRGDRVVTQADGVNRIRGGSVEIN